MDNKTIEAQAKAFVAELKTNAWEYGFAGDDAWEVVMANEPEKLKIEKMYYPTVAVAMEQEHLLELFHLVKAGLTKPGTAAYVADEENLAKNSQKFLVAYNLKRLS